MAKRVKGKLLCNVAANSQSAATTIARKKFPKYKITSADRLPAGPSLPIGMRGKKIRHIPIFAVYGRKVL